MKFKLILIAAVVAAPAQAMELPYVVTKPDCRGKNKAKCFTHKAIGAEDACSICLEKLQGAQDVVCIAPCDDHFHRDCLTGWQRAERSQSRNCPNCRRAIEQVVATPSTREQTHEVEATEEMDAATLALIQVMLNELDQEASNNHLDADAALARQMQDELFQQPVAQEMDEATRALVQRMLEEDGN